MKNRVCVLIAVAFAISLLCGGYASAQDGKIVFVDIQKLMTKSTKAKAQQDKFQDAMKKRTAHLEKLRADMDKLNKEINDKGPMLNEEKRVEMLRQMKYKEIDYQIAEQQAKAFMQNEQREAEQLFLQEIRDVISGIQKKYNYKLVLNSGALLAAEDAIDITDTVAKEYDSHKPAASAPQPKQPPRAAPTPAPAPAASDKKKR
ncbi:MAG: OmpH family outer membrane protein [Thermodesulfobacteriota bacterium]